MDFQLQFDADLASEKTRKKDVQVSQHILNIYIYIYCGVCYISCAVCFFLAGIVSCHVACSSQSAAWKPSEHFASQCVCFLYLRLREGTLSTIRAMS